MIVYGVAILSACVIVGKFLGDWLGVAIGVESNVGGVGIAMLLLIAICHRFDSFKKGFGDTALGISFWSAMYIPIVVAMAAKQNVLAALTGGPVALAAGLLAVLASLALLPILSGRVENDDRKPTTEGQE
ncbi:MAG TPA: malonate transporter subunit MadL [Gammaproteobacteria bacterium]|jgi:malonate transporter MadL subunit|nr:malonate transporter subunit MadL [Pseudomonadota bacterium]HAY44824.1 malonate transporter subunit MadL [Gammaproteobacteria bacterium]